MTAQPQVSATKAFEKNIFYVVGADGKENVVIANNEDEITGATLVISLEEVERIRERLIATLEVVASADFIEPPASANTTEEVVK